MLHFKVQKYFFVFVAVFVPPFFVYGCAKHTKNPQELVVAIEEYPSNLDPRMGRDAYSSKVNQLLFNGLLKYDRNLQLVPDLAEHYELLNEKTLKIKLREGIYFHQGSMLTTRDVEYTFHSLKNPKQISLYHSDFAKVKRMTLIDDFQMIIELKEVYAPFLTALTVGIVPQGADEDLKRPFKNFPVGTGPFQFVSAKRDREVVLKKNPHYFGKKSWMERIRIKTIKDDTTRVFELLKGSVDFIQNGVPYNMIPWLLGRSSLKLQKQEGINYQYLGFNLRDPILQNQKVRWAIAYLIDAQSLIDFKLKGYARPATGILSPTHWAYNGEVPRFHYDLEKAKRLLDDASYPDPKGELPRFELTYQTSTNPSHVDMALAMKELFSKAGIKINIQSFDWGIFYKDIRSGNFQMYSLSWVGVVDPDIYAQVFYSKNIPPFGANRGYYSNPEVDEQVILARNILDRGEQKKYYDEVQKQVANDLPYVSLWYPDNLAMMQSDLKDYYLTPNASFEGFISIRR